MIYGFPVKCCHFFSLLGINMFFTSWGRFSKEEEWEAHSSPDATRKGPVRHHNFHVYTLS